MSQRNGWLNTEEDRAWEIMSPDPACRGTEGGGGSGGAKLMLSEGKAPK